MSIAIFRNAPSSQRLIRGRASRSLLGEERIHCQSFPGKERSQPQNFPGKGRSHRHSLPGKERVHLIVFFVKDRMLDNSAGKSLIAFDNWLMNLIN
jgi:hypothetical protein